MELNEEQYKIIIEALTEDIYKKSFAISQLVDTRIEQQNEIDALKKTIHDAGDILRNCAVDDLSEDNLKKLKLLLHEQEIPF